MINTGSARKYFFYAIGEIGLVVIGILIALQVNNWNQNRIERIEEQLIYTRLIQDLEEDLNSIEHTIFNYQQRLIYGVKVLRQLESLNLKNILAWNSYLVSVEERPELSNTDDLSFGEMLFKILVIDLFYQTDNTFQELVSSGKIDLISDPELKGAIQSYYPNIKRGQKFQDQIVFTVQSKYRDALERNRISYLNRQSYKELMEDDVDQKDLVMAIENLLSLTQGFLNGLYIDDDSMKNQTEHLVNKIKTKLAERDK